MVYVQQVSPDERTEFFADTGLKATRYGPAPEPSARGRAKPALPMISEGSPLSSPSAVIVEGLGRAAAKGEPPDSAEEI